jgi:hypothetical protein
VALSQVFSVGWSGGGADTASARTTITGGIAAPMSFTLAGSTTDSQKQIGFDAAGVNGVLIIVTDNNGAVTLETNSSSAPDHTFAFPSGGGVLYWDNTFPSSVANPFGTTDVTTTYWTNAGSATATVEVRILLD